MSDENLNVDVVVVGGGGAGLAAAVTVASAGAKTALLEMRSVAGGATIFAEGIAAAESPVQERMHIDCTKDRLFKMQMYYNHWTLNARLVRAMVDISGDTIRWLEEKGLRFRLPHLYPDQEPLVWHTPDHYGTAVIKALLKECDDLGVQIFYKCRAKKLVQDQQRAVTGLIAENVDGTVTIRAKAVVIASGGYGGNLELLRKYCPDYYVDDTSIEMLKNIHLGDGIRMAFEAGAAEEGLGILLMHGPAYERRRRSPVTTSMFAAMIEPTSVWVNREGERFMEESASLNPFESPNGVLRQPGQLCYALFDEVLKEQMARNGFIRPFESGLYPANPSNIPAGIDDGIEAGSAKVADSWAEIAEWIGADPHVLAATIDEYNKDCDRGHDRLFVKDPKYLRPLRTLPYYALLGRPRHLVTIGGIRVNERMEVIGKDYVPIKGLYAAGIDTGGWSGATYNAQVPGSGCGFAIHGGRLAGAAVAAYVLPAMKGLSKSQ